MNLYTTQLLTVFLLLTALSRINYYTRGMSPSLRLSVRLRFPHPHLLLFHPSCILRDFTFSPSTDSCMIDLSGAPRSPYHQTIRLHCLLLLKAKRESLPLIAVPCQLLFHFFASGSQASFSEESTPYAVHHLHFLSTHHPLLTSLRNQPQS